MKKIEMGKKYRTRDGRDVRVLCVDRDHPAYTVVGMVGQWITSWESDGIHWERAERGLDLVEVPLYADIPIDTPGWARMTDLVTVSDDLHTLMRGPGRWVPRHFAGVSGFTGGPLCYGFGSSKHTSNGDCEHWDEFTTTKPEGV
jgi:hypothetical protein